MGAKTQTQFSGRAASVLKGCAISLKEYFLKDKKNCLSISFKHSNSVFKVS